MGTGVWPACMPEPHVHDWCQYRSTDSTRSPGAGVTGNRELCAKVLGPKLQFRQSSKCSNHRNIPLTLKFIFLIDM